MKTRINSFKNILQSTFICVYSEVNLTEFDETYFQDHSLNLPTPVSLT